MSTEPNSEFLKEQILFKRRELEKLYKLLNLNDVQAAELRVQIDRLVQDERREATNATNQTK